MLRCPHSCERSGSPPQTLNDSGVNWRKGGQNTHKDPCLCSTPVSTLMTSNSLHCHTFVFQQRFRSQGGSLWLQRRATDEHNETEIICRCSFILIP